MVKVIWHKTMSLPQTDSSVTFARWYQCALPCGHIGTTWQIWLKLCFLWPTQVHNPNGKLISSAISAQLTAESPYTLQWAPLSPKIAPFHGVSGPPTNTWFLEPIHDHNPNSISIGSIVFAQCSADCPYTLQWDAAPPQNCCFPWGDLDPI